MLKQFVSSFALILFSLTGILNAVDCEIMDTYRELVSDGDLIHRPEEYQEVAKYLGHYMFPGHDSEARIITYNSSCDSKNAIFRILWYADGYVVTQINGEKKDFQTVVWNGVIVGASYPVSGTGKESLYEYSWGRVCENCVYSNIRFTTTYIKQTFTANEE